MNEAPQALRPLRIVALLFFLQGMAAVFALGVTFAQGRLRLDTAVLGIPICVGLVRLSWGWRTWALVHIWLALISSALVVLVTTLGGPKIAFFSVYGIRLATLSPATFFPLLALTFLAFVWQYRVLTRPDVRALFLARR
jgi:hypothetical protein